MPIVPAITVSQSSLTPANITIVDASTGSDAAIASRKVSFQDSQGRYITTAGTFTTPTFETWAYADASKTWAILLEDMALFITVLWLDSGGATLYTFNDYYPLTKFNKNFAVYLGQQQALSPGITQDVNYANNWNIFWGYITQSIVMIEEAADISNSQNLMNKATYMRQNESKFF